MSYRDDKTLQEDVHDELDWTPDVESTRIGISVDKGVITLSGEVDSFAERCAARRAALRVRGAVAVVDDMTVHPPNGWTVTETDLAKEVERALRRTANVPASVRAEVTGHDVVLSGTADWHFQIAAVERAVRYLRGVRSVTNKITLSERPSREDTADRITAAFVRNARLDAGGIHVTASGTTVTLTGRVHSWAERVRAERAAWASPHVTKVDNQLGVCAWQAPSSVHPGMTSDADRLASRR